MRNLLISIALASLLAAGPALAQSKRKTFQCWTDEKGQRMCGDRVPPKYAGQDREVIDDRGVVVDTKEGAKTPEEIAAEKRRKQDEEAARRQAEYDRSLLQTYRSVKDLETIRDERLAFLDSRIQAAEKNLADTESTLADLQTRAQPAVNEGKEVDKRLASQIKQFEKAKSDNLRSLERLRSERSQVQEKFDRDIARFSELRGTPLPAPSPASAPAPAPEAKDPAAAAPATPGGGR